MTQLSAQALTSLHAARSFVLRKPRDGSQDHLLIPSINSVSKTIKRVCNRQFFPDAAATHSFSYSGNGYLSLEPFELRSVTSITAKPAYATTVMTLDPAVPDYQLEPVEKTPENTYLWLRLLRLDNPGAFPAHMGVGLRSVVTITGDWGMSEVPEDAEEACLIGVRWRYKNPDGQQSVQVGGEFGAVAYPPQSGWVPPLPWEAMALLSDLRRPEIGV